MPPVSIHTCTPNELIPLLAEYERQMDEVQRRAYHLFERRGGFHGHALNDWLDAERQILCLPQAESTEEEDSYRVVAVLSGFSVDQIQVFISPQDMVIRAESVVGEGTDFSLKAMTQHRFGQPLDIPNITASFNAGLLQIDVPKALQSRAAIVSEAATIDEIIQDLAASRMSERGGRADDRRSATAMEDRKKEGYF